LNIYGSHSKLKVSAGHVPTNWSDTGCAVLTQRSQRYCSEDNFDFVTPKELESIAYGKSHEVCR
jgi:hypothetical protein